MEVPSVVPSVVPVIKSKTIRDYIEYGIEYLMRKLIFWENNDKHIGNIIRFIHHSFIYVMIIFYISIHTIYPSYFMFIVFFCMYSIIWTHHIICRTCIFTRIEQRLMGDSTNFLDPLLDIFHLPKTQDVSDNILVMGSCFLMFTLICELLSRTIRSIIQIIS